MRSRIDKVDSGRHVTNAHDRQAAAKDFLTHHLQTLMRVDDQGGGMLAVIDDSAAVVVGFLEHGFQPLLMRVINRGGNGVVVGPLLLNGVV